MGLSLYVFNYTIIYKKMIDISCVSLVLLVSRFLKLLCFDLGSLSSLLVPVSVLSLAH